MTPEFSRPVSAAQVIDGRLTELEVKATPAEAEALAARLHIPSVLRLACRFALRPEAGRIVAIGRLEALVVQTCVVSLEPFEAEVVEDFEIHFVAGPAAPAEDDDPLAPDVIAYDGPTLDLGEAAAEQLALALDPFPRRPGAVLPEVEGEAGETNPFAALAGLRRH